MAEAEEHGAHMAEEAEGPPDPNEHIKDRVLFGVDATTGSIVRPYNAHGHLKAEYVSYVPAKVGPFKVEFTQHMAGMTLAATLILIAGVVTARRVLEGLQDHRAAKGRLANAFEAVVVFVRDEMVVPMGGHHLGHYTPLFITYFVFILTCNV